VAGGADVETVLKVVASLLALPVVALVALWVYVIAEALFYQGILGRVLERDLGFREGSASLPVAGPQGYISAVAIISVADGGVFAQAGFRAGDVLPEKSHTDLFKLLHRHRGRVAELAVVDGGPGPPFRERQRRVIRFAVPLRVEGQSQGGSRGQGGSRAG
jgi:hypothetical protein